MLRAAAAWFVGLVFLSSCDDVRDFSSQLLDRRSLRQRYLDGLDQAGLANTAVFQDWLRAGARALTEAPLVTPPHREEVSLPPTEPAAIGLQVELRRGQLVSFAVSVLGDSTIAVFLEAWQSGEPGDTAIRLVAESEEGERSLTFEPRIDGRHLFRAQPELLRGGRFSVSLAIAPTLAFPVHGKGERDIKSRWGASRDGGRRSHHGIDIFAPRGTPVLAAAAGRVAEVGENELGGSVVWLRDDRGNTHYYAHLSKQLVSNGQVVRTGDTLGLVGNTGNARTTSPHLHFGIYRRGEGPVDPFWFVHNPRGSAPRLTADTALLARQVRLPRTVVVLRRGPSSETDSVARVGPDAPVRVLGAVGAWFRVEVGGVTGFLPARGAKPVTGPVRAGASGTGVVTAGMGG